MVRLLKGILVERQHRFNAFRSLPNFLILLRLTPDNFTRQGETSWTGKIKILDMGMDWCRCLMSLLVWSNVTIQQLGIRIQINPFTPILFFFSFVLSLFFLCSPVCPFVLRCPKYRTLFNPFPTDDVLYFITLAISRQFYSSRGDLLSTKLLMSSTIVSDQNYLLFVIDQCQRYSTRFSYRNSLSVVYLVNAVR